jgi:hypothetical protein
MRLLLVMTVGFCTSLGSLAQVASTTNIAGRTVSLAQDAAAAQTSTDSLTTRSVELKPGENVKEVLRQSGVEPNSDALSVFYSLNPGVYKVDDANDFTVKIPALKSFDPAHATPVSLKVDSELKNSIALTSADLDTKTMAWPTAMRATLSPAVNALKETSVSIEVHPASSPFLNQVERESALLDQYSRKASLTGEDKKMIAEINFDLRAKNKAIQSDDSDPDITVRTLAAKDQSEVGLLTICYVPVFLDQGKCDAEFERPSSPTDHKLPIANYHIWAANAAGAKVSNVKRIEVRETTTVVLVVTP